GPAPSRPGAPLSASLQIELRGTSQPVQGDSELLRIVFQNLLINAAQAVEGRGSITVTFERESKTQRVSIKDGGPGLTAEAQRNLFRSFFTTKARGTGLGLPTAKRLVELHGGSITIESTPGAGTAVAVSLPTAPTRDVRA